MLLVEQHVRKALEYADRAYVMRRGRIELSGTADDCWAGIGEIEDRYLTARRRCRPHLTSRYRDQHSLGGRREDPGGRDVRRTTSKGSDRS